MLLLSIFSPFGVFKIITLHLYLHVFSHISDDFRIFVGDLGNEVSDDALLRAFSRYPSLLKARVVRDKKTKKTKGFGFVSFKDPQDYLKAMREMHGMLLFYTFIQDFECFF